MNHMDLRPSTFKGRQQRIFITEGQERRHFWGQKGKNYGFYTTSEELDMEKRIKNLQRNQSEYSALKKREDRYRSLDPINSSLARIKTEPTQHDMYADNVEKEQTTLALETNPELHYFNSKLKKVLKKGDKKDLNLISKNVELRLFPENIEVKLPVIKPSTVTKKDEMIQTKTNSRSLKWQEPPRIVYYQRRNRELNPTFCNSAAYPLPCYRRAI